MEQLLRAIPSESFTTMINLATITMKKLSHLHIQTTITITKKLKLTITMNPLHMSGQTIMKNHQSLFSHTIMSMINMFQKLQTMM